MRIEETKGTFGFHLTGGKDDPQAAYANVQIFVRSSALSRSADLAISPHLMTEGVYVVRSFWTIGIWI